MSVFVALNVIILGAVPKSVVAFLMGCARGTLIQVLLLLVLLLYVPLLWMLLL